MNLPLPRKIASAAARSLAEVGQGLYTFSSDVYSYLEGLQREDADRDSRIAALEAARAASGAISQGVQVWDFRVPPESPHAMNDEGDGTIFNVAKWSTWNPGAISFTPSLDTERRMIKLVAARQAGVSWAGIYQAIPSSEFTVYAHVMLAGGSSATAIRAGLFAFQDIAGAPTTSDFVGPEIGRGAVNTTDIDFVLQRSTAWTAYNGAVPANIQTKGGGMGSAILRLRVDGTDVMGDASHDAKGFHELRTTTLASITHVGLAVHSTGGSGADAIVYVDFFRVFDATSDADGSRIGGFL